MADMVYFTAVADQGGYVGPKAADSTLKFDTNITNIGAAYDNTSGVFTAPFTGVYFFTFSYHAGNENQSGLSLIKNNSSNVIVRAFDNKERDETFSDNAGNSAVLDLQRGDKVFVQLPAGRRVWAADRTTSFSGFLVAKK